jgi:hypothetical protein
VHKIPESAVRDTLAEAQGGEFDQLFAQWIRGL